MDGTHPILTSAVVGSDRNFDFSDPLLQLKHRERRIRSTHLRGSLAGHPAGFDRIAEPEHPFKIADRFGYRGLLNAQLRRRLGA